MHQAFAQSRNFLSVHPDKSHATAPSVHNNLARNRQPYNDSNNDKTAAKQLKKNKHAKEVNTIDTLAA